MNRFYLTIAVTTVISAITAGCSTGGRQCCDDEDRAVGLFTSREAPRGEVGVSMPGVLRSTPATRGRDDAAPRSRSTTAIAPDGDQDGGLETDRLTDVEKKVSRLTELLEALNSKVNEKCK